MSLATIVNKIRLWSHEVKKSDSVSIVRRYSDKVPYVVFVTWILVLYSDTLFYGYVSDDFDLVNLKTVQLWDLLMHGPHFRPIWYLSYIVTNLCFQSSFFEHLVNLVLFISACNFAFYYVRQELPKHESMIIVFIWVSLPWMLFPVVWISQRCDLLMYNFTFLSLLAYKRNRYILASVFMSLAFLSKVTVVFVPIFFIYKGLKERNRISILTNTVILIIFFMLAFRGLLNNTEQEHVQNIGFCMKAMNYGLHIFESLLMQFFPVPFFRSAMHCFVLLLAYACLFFALRYKSHRSYGEGLILVLLLMLPSAINSELRVVGFQSFFILILFCHMLKVTKYKPFAVFLLLFCLFNVYAILGAKKNFQTLDYDPDSRQHCDSQVSSEEDRVYYNNSYYSAKRKFLVETLQSLRKSNEDLRGP